MVSAYLAKNKPTIESIQLRAARFAVGDYQHTNSVIEMLFKLGRTSLSDQSSNRPFAIIEDCKQLSFVLPFLRRSNLIGLVDPSITSIIYIHGSKSPTKIMVSGVKNISQLREVNCEVSLASVFSRPVCAYFSGKPILCHTLYTHLIY